MRVRCVLIVLASSTAILSSAFAQGVTPPPSGIPNGLSGPGGTVTFSEAPTIQTSPAVVAPLVPRGSISGSGHAQTHPKPHVRSR